ncbi:asparaginyl endopeptidase [Capsaspora owczarzaki ATCC 30864]|uniref:legumain n=1 Tax=Capsaspora owczarzaki (strain ATCC 30864) TaxID=595528 RepID=A0A0D2X1W8_CAPO3|nr:asparaginyl endopeptidase [Capsaspora owczarzaki ATCC 30864]KJE91534.1 asparaginyl endopeptidase [Capsaspora owczarzaki ATCC 30864]|eukprot:XP_004349412.1 asparaginyl endopeptidase [Capsaspora owczarzaki ATCC 30864]
MFKVVALALTLLVASAAARPHPHHHFPKFRDGADGNGTNWAVLVAGSNTYSNYRHQADVYHAYQILHKNGYPDSNIIVFHYDDIASSSQVSKQICIQPHSWRRHQPPERRNVYVNVPKDYTGDNVNPTTFLQVLRGIKPTVGSGKTLQSGPNDNVFINFVDHGATGLIAFPNDYLYANDLLSALSDMKNSKMYAQLVFYLEACESGSMFTSLPTNAFVFATTAANPDESSYATYWDDTYQTYLGDLYSVNWMENTDIAANLQSESLQDQFLAVQQLTNLSHVMEYGQLSLDALMIRQFLTFPNTEIEHHGFGHPAPASKKDSVSSRDVDLETHRRRLAAASTDDERRQAEMDLTAQQARREFITSTIHAVTARVAGVQAKDALVASRFAVNDFDCYKASVAAYERVCGRFGSFGMQYMYILANLCESGYTADQVSAAAQYVCN